MKEKLHPNLKDCFDYFINKDGLYYSLASNLTNEGNLLESSEKIVLKVFAERIKSIEEFTGQNKKQGISYEFYKDFIGVWDKIINKISRQIQDAYDETPKKINLSRDEQEQRNKNIAAFEKEVCKMVDKTSNIFAECYGKYLQFNTTIDKNVIAGR